MFLPKAEPASVTLQLLYGRPMTRPGLEALLHPADVAQVEVVLGPASESIAKLAARGVRFDLAFLDADKTGYLGYYEQVLSIPSP
jgi:predicted O-methyltransferase YrrM